MTSPRWPASLPPPLLAEYGESVTPPTVVFEPDVGNPLTRRRGTIHRKEITATFRVTSDQLRDFEEFFFNEIASGTLAFRMTHPRQRTDRLFRISIRQNDPAYSISPKTPLVFDVKMRLLEVGP